MASFQPAQPSGVDMEFQDMLTAANDYLQSCYISIRYSPTVDEWPPYQPRHYTTLALIHHKDKCTDATVISITQELVVTGKFQPKVECLSSGDDTAQILNINSSTTKNISDIFESVTASNGLTINPSVILIEGAPGIGKTVLAKEIAFLWANNKLLCDKKILLLIFLRECDFKIITSVESLIKHVVQSNKISQSLTEYLVQTHGKDLAIIFDGYDEISEEDRKDSIMTRIIDRRMYTKSCIVITSRPTASSTLHSIVDCWVEIVGFTEEDRFDYIQTALQDNEDKVKDLTLYLQSNPTINALCYIPLNMTILLCLAEDGVDKLPKSQTDMYKKFVEMTILRFIKKSDLKANIVITSITRLPCPYNKMFEELAQLAYNALKVDKIIFKLNEIEDACPNLAMTPNNWSGLGLLKAVQYANAEVGNVTFHFLHFSIQEYMAALYISTLSNNKQIKLLKETFWQHRYYNTWIMYIGITQGRSFALKHFLSGNRFQLLTKIFKTSGISKEILQSKIKCLHLLQCLVESNNKDMISSVSEFFQDNQIDLSNQTLLPSDVNTLGFFLMRSINKHWESLNLSGCNIGNIGINILCDRFLSKESREIVVIEKINFSYNQLNFSSLLPTFDLFTSWHASQLNIRDNEILQNYATSDVFEIIENTFCISSYHKPVTLEIGSFLFGHKTNMFPIFLNAEIIEDVYLLDCTLIPTTPSASILELLAEQSLSEIHLINTPLSTQSMKIILTGLLIMANVFIFNPELSDQDADNMCSSLLSSKLSNELILIISGNKIQGTINTATISECLTKLELFNLAVNVNQKSSTHMQTYPWKCNLSYDNSDSDLITDTFIKLLHKIACNKWNWQLRIALFEKDVLVAHKVDYECLSEKITMYQFCLKAIYLNYCNIKSEKYQTLCNTKSNLTKLYIFNSHLDQHRFVQLRKKLFLCKEIFIHVYSDINISDINTEIIASCFKEDHSTVLVTKNEIFGCNPTTKQIALALQLEPSIDVLKLLHCQRNFDLFSQVITMLTATQSNWTKIHVMYCKLGEIEFEILKKHMQIYKQNLNLETQLIKPFVPEFIKTILKWKELIVSKQSVQQLVFSNINYTIINYPVYKCFITKFTATITDEMEEVFLSVTYNSTKYIYLNNYSWNPLTTLLGSDAGDTLFIVNCSFPLLAKNLRFNQISELYLINCTLLEDTIVNILETFIERKLSISICNISMNMGDNVLYKFVTSKKQLYQSRVNFLALMKNFMCAYNTTRDQIQLLLSQKLNNTERAIVTVVSGTKDLHEKELFVFQNNRLTALHNAGSQAYKTAQLLAVLKGISTLKFFGIDNCTITGSTFDALRTSLSHNKRLEQLFLNSKIHGSELLKVMEVLVKFVNLKHLEICNVTDQIAEHLTSVISHNTQLQYFSITNGNFCAISVIKISKALKNISNLQELTIIGNTGATNIIAVSMSNNNQIQKHNFDENDMPTKISNNISEEVVNDITTDISKYNLQSTDAVKITKALQNVSKLMKLHISDYDVSDEAADCIAAVICNYTQLRELDVSKNYLQSTGAIKVAKALQNMCTLTKLYINNNRITDEAADDIAAVIHSNTELQEFDISKNKFSLTGAIKIANALKDVSTLTKLYINDNYITDKAASHIAAALACNIQLQELNISDNYFQAVGIIIITKALKDTSTFKKLFVSNSNITDEAADDIAAAIHSSTELQEFDISKNSLSSTGAIKIVNALKHVSTLTKLYINDNNITDTAASHIAAALACNTQLQELDIRNNCFEVASIMSIARALQHTVKLTKLYIGRYIDYSVSGREAAAKTRADANIIAAVLYHNTELQEVDLGLHDVMSVIFITKALYKNRNLRVLRMKGNKLLIRNPPKLLRRNAIKSYRKIYSRMDAVENIAAVVSSNRKLEVIEISRIPALDYLKILAVLKNISSLTSLCISYNNLSDNTSLCISDNNLSDIVADDIAAVVSNNAQLQELDVSNNVLTAVGAIKISKALQNISTLTKLCINDNHITDDAADDITAALYCNTHIQELNISNSCIQVVGAMTILKALQCTFLLKKLYISNNNITDEVADDIAAAICSNAGLQEFDVSRNRLQSTGAIKIAKALQNVSTLTKLYINDNHITYEAANDIAGVLSCNTQLQELNISSNYFQVVGIMTIINALQGIFSLKKLYISNSKITNNVALVIATVISSNIQLQELDISKNSIQSKGAIMIAKALQNIPTLMKLYIYDNQITEEAADYIRTTLSQLQVLVCS